MSNKKQKWKSIINFVILLLSMELIHIILAEIPEFRNIDIRIAFIFVIANSMGMKYGILSAVISSVLYVMQDFSDISDISIIFLNTNNWLQSVIYLVFAIIIGLKHDKDTFNFKTLQNSINDLKEKSEQDNKKIEKYEKELIEFNQVLLTHEKTYIQVSDFIEKLNTVKNDNKKINKLLSKVLNNNTCKLTTFNEIENYITKEKIEELKEKNIWVNINLEEKKPMYISPVITKEQDLALVVMECKFEQMNIDYRNQIMGVSKIIKYVLSH